MKPFLFEKMLTQLKLKEFLFYQKETGIFYWIKRNSNRAVVGKIAGTKRKEDPYIIITVNRKRYYAHRLAWLYIYGCMPKDMIDHKDRDKSNNRIDNLRIATFTQNAYNKSTAPRSKTKLKGVWVARNKFAAYIGNGEKRRRLGLFDTAEEAHSVFLRAAKDEHGDFLFNGSENIAPLERADNGRKNIE